MARPLITKKSQFDMTSKYSVFGDYKKFFEHSAHYFAYMFGVVLPDRKFPIFLAIPIF